MSQQTIEMTPENKKFIDDQYREYIKAGLTTEPAPRAEVEAAVKRIYKREGISEEPVIYWANGMQEAKRILTEAGVTNHSTGLWGSMDLYWLARFDVARKLGIKYDEKDNAELDDLLVIAKAGMWWAYEDVLIMDTPKVLKVDEMDNLHCDDGPAVEYRNGEKIFMIHGHEVPELVVMHPENITIPMIDNERNAEVKRIMVDRYGVNRYAVEKGAKILDKDTGLSGMPRLLVQDADRNKWLIGTDGGTGRVYWMPVFSEATTCKSAHDGIARFDERRIVAEA